MVLFDPEDGRTKPKDHAEKHEIEIGLLFDTANENQQGRNDRQDQATERNGLYDLLGCGCHDKASFSVTGDIICWITLHSVYRETAMI
jgi:hypothetical protein